MPRKPRAFRLLSFALLLLVLELCVRALYAINYQQAAILLRPRALFEVHYPGIEKAANANLQATGDTLHVLLLGGSVLESKWGNIAELLQNKLAAQVGQPVKCWNMAASAHTSLDSRIKYSLLCHQPYDAVLLYHGINETRFNNCAEQHFRADYSHVAWYRNLHALENPLSAVSILPFAWAQLTTGILQKTRSEALVPFNLPENAGTFAHGAHIKTAASFQHNYEQLVAQTASRGTPLVLPTFAVHPQANYTPARFKARQLDYAGHICPMEIWGTAAHVIAGVAAHNTRINALCAQAPATVQCIPLNAQMPKGAAWFNDVCHLTDKGCEAYVEIVVGAWPFGHLQKPTPSNTAQSPPAQ